MILAAIREEMKLTPEKNSSKAEKTAGILTRAELGDMDNSKKIELSEAIVIGAAVSALGAGAAATAAAASASTGLGATSVVDANGKFIGLVTDGDVRRCLAKGPECLNEPVEHFMTKKPETITKDKLAASALSLMEKHQPRPITVLPVVDEDGFPLGIVHLTDLLRQGVV